MLMKHHVEIGSYDRAGDLFIVSFVILFQFLITDTSASSSHRANVFFEQLSLWAKLINVSRYLVRSF
jgi:hypothetical protein